MTLFWILESFFFLSGWRRKIRRKHPSGRKMGRPDGKATGTIFGDFDRSEKLVDRSNKLLNLLTKRPSGRTQGVRSEMLLEQLPKTFKIMKTQPFFQKIQPNDTKKTQTQ